MKSQSSESTDKINANIWFLQSNIHFILNTNLSFRIYYINVKQLQRHLCTIYDKLCPSVWYSVNYKSHLFVFNIYHSPHAIILVNVYCVCEIESHLEI